MSQRQQDTPATTVCGGIMLAHTWASYEIRAQNQLHNTLFLLFSDQSPCWKQSALIDWSQLESESHTWVTDIREFGLWKTKKYDMFAGRLPLPRLPWSHMQNQTPGDTFQKLAFFRAPPASGLCPGLFLSCQLKSMPSTPMNFPRPIHVMLRARLLGFITCTPS